jgi:hypothetical protein
LLELAHQFRGLVGRHSSRDAECHTHDDGGALLLAPLSFLVLGLARNDGQLVFQNACV